jgi:hypothetical protein
MVAVVVGVIGLSLAFQTVDGIPFLDSLILALLITNLAVSLLVLQKRANSEDTSPRA